MEFNTMLVDIFREVAKLNGVTATVNGSTVIVSEDNEFIADLVFTPTEHGVRVSSPSIAHDNPENFQTVAAAFEYYEIG